jgi:hypothetical protein
VAECRLLNCWLARLLKRRSAIEPEIGHMKSDGRLARLLQALAPAERHLITCQPA